MLFNQKQLTLAKVESTPGTDASPTKTDDAILTGPVEISIDHQQLDRMAVRQSIAAIKMTIGRSMATLTIPVELKGSGAAGTAPEMAPLLQACGYKETVSAGVSVGYKPSSTATDHKTLTIYFYVDGLLFKIFGAMGNKEISLPPGGYGRVNFTMTGKLASVTDVALPASPTLDATLPPQIESLDVTIGAWDDAVVRSMVIKSGNNIKERPDVNSVDGYATSAITARNPTAEFLIEAVLEATNAFWTNFLARTEQNLSMVVGTSTGNIITITCDKFCPTSIAPTQEDGLEMYQVVGQCLENSGDDDVEIVFT
jgi:hypothetical protein